jgi:hypothetical protein
VLGENGRQTQGPGPPSGGGDHALRVASLQDAAGGDGEDYQQDDKRYSQVKCVPRHGDQASDLASPEDHVSEGICGHFEGDECRART